MYADPLYTRFPEQRAVMEGTEQCRELGDAGFTSASVRQCGPQLPLSLHEFEPGLNQGS